MFIRCILTGPRIQDKPQHAAASAPASKAPSTTQAPEVGGTTSPSSTTAPTQLDQAVEDAKKIAKEAFDEVFQELKVISVLIFIASVLPALYEAFQKRQYYDDYATSYQRASS